MTPTRIVAKCGCGRSFTAEQWLTLDRVGTMESDEGPRGEPAERMEMRNCPCRSTQSVTVEVFCPEAGGWAWAGDVGEYIGLAVQSATAREATKRAVGQADYALARFRGQ